MSRKPLLVLLLVFSLASSGAMASTYWVSSSSSSSSPCSSGNPCKPSAVWNHVSPGDTVIFKDGVYTGADYMLDPPPELDGTSSQRITVRAETDGGVRIDGQGQRIPVELWQNRYYVIEGFNAHSSSETVFKALSGSNNIFRRCIGWDANDLNAGIFVSGSNALIEDCGAFGVGRKLYDTVYQDNVTFRRIWGRWEGSTHTGPKITLDSFYFSQGTRIENAILTWDNGSMPSNWYTNDGESILSGPYQGWQSGNPRGTLHQGKINPGEECVNVRVHGLISYIKGSSSGDYNRFADGRALIDYDTISMHPCCLSLDNVASWIDPGNSQWSDNFGFNLGPGCDTQSSKDLTISNISQVHQTSSNIHGDWAQSDLQSATSSSGLSDSIYVGQGAAICNRYENGSTTDVPLWPWPMQDRILAATTFASAANTQVLMTQCSPGSSPQCQQVWVNDPHAPADVMADITAMFGAPPASCSADGSSDDDDDDAEPPPPPEDVWRTDTLP